MGDIYKMFKNVIDMYRAFSSAHGHLWAIGDPTDEVVRKIEVELENTKNYDQAVKYAISLSEYVSAKAADELPPHNIGIEFDPECLCHRTGKENNGRESWCVLNENSILYTIFRPEGIALELKCYLSGKIKCIFRSKKIQLEKRHYFTILKTFVDSGFNTADIDIKFPDGVLNEFWRQYLHEEKYQQNILSNMFSNYSN
jgi:hypothetical protein